MSWPKNHKDQTKSKVLAVASKLFATHGFKQVTIDHVMQEAGFTRGIFYTYFKTKADLYQQSILFSATQTRQQITDAKNMDLAQVAHAYIEHNLDLQKQVKCPIAFLATDILNHDSDIRFTYKEVLKQFINNIQNTGLEKEQAIQAGIMMIGSVVLANAIDDETLKKEIISAAKSSF